MTYTINITKKAKQDIFAAMDYIEYTLFNPQAADNLLDQIENTIIPLSAMPLIHPIIEDSVLQSLQIRYIPVNNYIVFYTVYKETQTVNIIRFLYGKRNWEEILKTELP